MPFTCVGRYRPDGPSDAGVRWNGWLGTRTASIESGLKLEAVAVDPVQEAWADRQTSVGSSLYLSRESRTSGLLVRKGRIMACRGQMEECAVG